MRRILLFLLAFAALFWWIGRVLKSARGQTPARTGPAPKGHTPAQGRMVRDRVCNTFLPESSALRLEIDSEEHFFCSEACRDRFLAEKSQ
jgi:YHS domain-containing protein